MKAIRQSLNVIMTLLFTIFSISPFVHAQNFPTKSYAQGLLPSNRNGQDAVNNYTIWKTNFLQQCNNGRYRVKFDSPNQTVSEGIGYGMLLTAYAGDRTEFDGLWNYYKDNRNVNGVMNWKINGCSGTIGQNGATDAEVDAALALIKAHNTWGSSGAINYNHDARALITAMKNYEVEAGSFVLKPGDQFGGSSLTNPSYFAPGYFRVFAKFMNDTFWNNVANKCYEIINKNLTANNAVGGIVSDWCNANGQYTSNGYQNSGKTYLYDAARTPWRIAIDYVWFGNNQAKIYSKKSSEFVRVNLGGSQNIVDGYYQNGSRYGQYHNATFVGAFACAAMGGDNQAHLNNSYSDLKNLNEPNSYFNQTLKTLYLFLLNGNFYMPDSGTIITDPNPSTSLVNGAVYKIISKNSNKAVDVLNVSTANGANVQQYGYGGGNNQKWRAESLPSGFWKLISINSGKCLEVSGYSNDIGANIQQWDYVGHNYQQWKVESLGDGSFKVTNRGSGKVLDVSGISQNDGANIHQWNFLNGVNQKWIFTRVDGVAREIQSKAIDYDAITLYPNPTSGQITIEVSEHSSIVITDSLGKIILEKLDTPQLNIFDLSNQKGDIYFVKVMNNEEVNFKKLIIE